MGALGALGIAVGDRGVRVVAIAEVALGALALAVSGALVALAVAVSYACFALVVVVALVRQLPIDSCGCLGRLETPPGGRHLVAIGVALVGALDQAADPGASTLERLTEDGVGGVVFVVGVLMLAAVGVVLFRAGRRPSTPR